MNDALSGASAPSYDMGEFKAWAMEQTIAHCGLEAYGESLHECVQSDPPPSNAEAVLDAQSAVSEAARAAAQKLTTQTPQGGDPLAPKTGVSALPARQH
ncbi:MAG: hypothetical protein AAFY60_10345 [Myxococcota bacterium]